MNKINIKNIFFALLTTLVGFFLFIPQHSYAADILEFKAGENFHDDKMKDSTKTTAYWNTEDGELTISDSNVVDKSLQAIHKTKNNEILDTRLIGKIINSNSNIVALSAGTTTYKMATFVDGQYTDFTDKVPKFIPGNSIVRFIDCNYTYCIFAFDVLGEDRSHLMRVTDKGVVSDLDDVLVSLSKTVSLTASGYGNGEFLIAGKEKSGTVNLYKFNDVSMFEVANSIPTFDAARTLVYTISWGDNRWLVAGGSYDNKTAAAVIFDPFANKITPVQNDFLQLLESRIIFHAVYDENAWYISATDKDRYTDKTYWMQLRLALNGSQIFQIVHKFNFGVYDVLREGNIYYLSGEDGHVMEINNGTYKDYKSVLIKWNKNIVYAVAIGKNKSIFALGSGGKMNQIEAKSQRAGVAFSQKINTVDGGINYIQLVIDDERPVGTTIKYLISVNGGKSWKEVKNLEVINFSNDKGSDLRWQVQLNTNSDSVRPKVTSIFINYKLIKYDYISVSPIKQFGGALLSKIIGPIKEASEKYVPKEFKPYADDRELTSDSGFVFGNGGTQLVTAPSSGEPLLRIFDAASNEKLYETDVYHPSFTGGVNVVVANLDNNGTEEIIVAPKSNGGPHVRVYTYDGNNKLRLYGQFFAYDQKFRGGVNITTGDVDGDGMDEIVTWPNNGALDIRVWKYRGAEIGWWSLDWRIMPYSKNYLGGAEIMVGNITWDPTFDITVDKREELVIVPTGKNAPELVVYGLDQNEKWRQHARVLGVDPNFTNGMHLAVGNMYGNSFQEIIVWPNGAGRKNANIWQWSSSDAKTDLKKVNTITYPTGTTSYNGVVNFKLANTEGDEHEEVVIITSSDEKNKKAAKFEVFTLSDVIKEGKQTFEFKLKTAVDVFKDIKNKFIDFIMSF